MSELKIYNSDCLEALKGFADNQFDLAIVDPPYGINAPNMQMGANKNKNKSGTSDSVANKLRKNRMQRLNGGGGKLKNRILNTSKIDWDYEQPSDEYFDQLFRVTKNQIIWGGNYFDLPPTRCVVCWDKVQPWENFSQWEMAWTSFDKPASLYRYSNKGGANLETKIHPTQKPKSLYKFLLKRYAQEGDTILDTHLGSGSIAIACHDMGYDLTAYEIDSEYFAAAKKRINNHIKQLMIF